MWNSEIDCKSSKAKGQSSPTNDGHWGDQKMTGDEESPNLWDPGGGGAEENSCDSQHRV